MARTILKYSALVLFIFSACELAFSLASMLMADFMSLELASVLSSVFVSDAQNAALVAINAIIGCVCGYLGLYMSRNEAEMITYKRLSLALIVIWFIAGTIFISMSGFNLLQFVIIAVIALCFGYGAWDYGK